MAKQPGTARSWTPGAIRELAMSFQSSRILLTAVELGVFSLIGDGEHDDARVEAFVLQRLQHLDAVHVLHVEVKQDHVGAPPMLLAIRSELGMSLFLAGWILSAFNVIGFLLGSLTGAASDAFGHRRLRLTGLSLQPLGSLAGSFSPAAFFLLTTRAMEGMGFLIAVVAAPAMVAQVTRPGISGWLCRYGAASFLPGPPPSCSLCPW